MREAVLSSLSIMTVIAHPLDDRSITSKSLHIESTILWTQVLSLEKTSQGWLVAHRAGKNYISSTCLSAQAEEFFVKKSISLATQAI